MEQPQIRPTLTLTLERVALGFSLLLFRIIMQPFTLRVIESAFGVVVGHRKDPCIAYCMKKPQGVTHWHMDYMSHW